MYVNTTPNPNILFHCAVPLFGVTKTVTKAKGEPKRLAVILALGCGCRCLLWHYNNNCTVDGWKFTFKPYTTVLFIKKHIFKAQSTLRTTVCI